MESKKIQPIILGSINQRYFPLKIEKPAPYFLKRELLETKISQHVFKLGFSYLENEEILRYCLQEAMRESLDLIQLKKILDKLSLLRLSPESQLFEIKVALESYLYFQLALMTPIHKQNKLLKIAKRHLLKMSSYTSSSNHNWCVQHLILVYVALADWSNVAKWLNIYYPLVEHQIEVLKLKTDRFAHQELEISLLSRPAA